MLNNIAGHMSQLPLRGVCVSAGGAKKRGSLLETSGGITESKLRESAPSPVSEILRCAEDTWSFLGRDRCKDRIGLTMRSERTGPRCPRTHFHLSHPCFSSDAKREPSSRSVYVAAPVQMGFRSIPFITLHTLPFRPCPRCLIPCASERCTAQVPCHPSPAPHPSYQGHSHKGRVALRCPHHPRSSASHRRGQTGLDGVEGFN